MSDPIAFPGVTPSIGLPLLIAGQAQKEFFVNKALCVLDALLTRTIVDSLPSPPPAAVDSSCFRVIGPATAEWAGHEDELATLVGGEWHFVSPVAGMQVFDQTAGKFVVYRSQWESAATPSAPAGGSVVDVEARSAIAAIVTALQVSGVLGSIGT